MLTPLTQSPGNLIHKYLLLDQAIRPSACGTSVPASASKLSTAMRMLLTQSNSTLEVTALYLLTATALLKSGTCAWLNKKCSLTVASPLLTVLFSTRAAVSCMLRVKIAASKYSMCRHKKKKENLKEDTMTLCLTSAGTTPLMAT